MSWLKSDGTKHRMLAVGCVTPEPSRCVQCGVCSFHCPMGIDVRRRVWQGQAVMDAACLTCGECVKRCPRVVLRFSRIDGADDTDRGSER